MGKEMLWTQPSCELVSALKSERISFEHIEETLLLCTNRVAWQIFISGTTESLCDYPVSYKDSPNLTLLSAFDRVQPDVTLITVHSDIVRKMVHRWWWDGDDDGYERVVENDYNDYVGFFFFLCISNHSGPFLSLSIIELLAVH